MSVSGVTGMTASSSPVLAASALPSATTVNSATQQDCSQPPEPLISQQDSYAELRGYIMSLHLNLNPAPPGRESAPPSPQQAAIDAYTGR